ncbi:MAG: LysR family transcriptional regulator [Alphaproteobacteria bacterium]|nr:LysR family transcriptional regulator [Alphaproteobacteria bacterium]
MIKESSSVINYTQIKAFNAVVKEGSFSKAGLALGLSQPAITVQVKSLEQTYGVRLFTRHGRNIVPTELGHALFDLTKQLFDIEIQAQELLSSTGRLLQGQLRLGAEISHTAMHLMSSFTQQHRKVDLTLKLATPQDLLEDILSQRLDIIILSDPDEDPRLYYFPLWRRRLMLLLPRNHKWATRRSVRLQELSDQSMITQDYPLSLQQKLNRFLQEHKVSINSKLHITKNKEAVREAVAMGIGLSLMLEGEMGHDSRLAAVPIQEEASLESLETLVCLKTHVEVDCVREFIKMSENNVPVKRSSSTWSNNYNMVTPPKLHIA